MVKQTHVEPNVIIEKSAQHREQFIHASKGPRVHAHGIRLDRREAYIDCVKFSSRTKARRNPSGVTGRVTFKIWGSAPGSVTPCASLLLDRRFEQNTKPKNEESVKLNRVINHIQR